MGVIDKKVLNTHENILGFYANNVTKLRQSFKAKPSEMVII